MMLKMRLQATTFQLAAVDILNATVRWETVEKDEFLVCSSDFQCAAGMLGACLNARSVPQVYMPVVLQVFLTHEADTEGVNRVFIDMFAVVDAAANSGAQQEDGTVVFAPLAE
jgi:hypothetical protein